MTDVSREIMFTKKGSLSLTAKYVNISRSKKVIKRYNVQSSHQSNQTFFLHKTDYYASLFYINCIFFHMLQSEKGVQQN